MSVAGPLGTPIPLRWSHFWAVLQRTGGNGNLGPLTRVSWTFSKNASSFINIIALNPE